MVLNCQTVTSFLPTSQCSLSAMAFSSGGIWNKRFPGGRLCAHLYFQPLEGAISPAKTIRLLRQHCGQKGILPSTSWAPSGFSLHYLPCKLDSRGREGGEERGLQMLEMLHVKTVYVCLPFLFFPFNIKQPFSLLVLCLRIEEQHLLETKEREW